ncbi:sulfur carrier protein ThiS [Virgisporangium aurantiacum]|uniref:Thiamine biosynthesis protein ThiS n=1 Tax=Virgisporangium aurantiacum TaxID=175570 RepID=A0A8J4E1P0_9ACTN|nr:sulfur carrier protein ThiS [Virgisporangium aurantiacum]GIJ58990.1 thiamine biosynthesis protein ThiS [Virgisporangium aurantiacum]
MNVTVNGTNRETPAGSTVDDVVRELSPTNDRGLAVAVNGEVVPRYRWGVTPLGEGDSIEILTAVQGG